MRGALSISTLVLLVCIKISAQTQFNADTVQAGVYDMGKMWTFDYPPQTYFQQTYQFSPDTTWFNEVRLSALRFADYCSASFVSEDGLVMTNHHCARESGTAVQSEDEDFNKNGFYARKQTDERHVPGLYVDQLVKIEDITAWVQSAMDKDTVDKLAARDSVIKQIENHYKLKPDWIPLTIQTITFYNGGKYSLYGFKRHNDVRLVFMPEVQLGFFGGDYDNFTYPRYALDCSFFRVYDENGKPIKTSHFFKFSKAGAQEGEPVFVVGNPGTTRRLASLSELAYRRDQSLPLVLRILHNRSLAMQEFNQVQKDDSILNEIFGFENSIKAYTGEVKQLSDPYLMARKAAFEKDFKKRVASTPSISGPIKVWDSIAYDVEALKTMFVKYFLFGGRAVISGTFLERAYNLSTYAYYLEKGDTSKALAVKMAMTPFENIKYPALEEKYLAAFLLDCKNELGDTSTFVKAVLNGMSPAECAEKLMIKTTLLSTAMCDSIAEMPLNQFKKLNDPILKVATHMVAIYRSLADDYKKHMSSLNENRAQLGRLLFDIYGTKVPPDATFSLRINDGIVQGYEYNGTKAPSQTTFSGLYDRYYSFNKQHPWDLPQRWQRPPMDLMSIPFNFVSTNDIIGGNSGSPIINKNREVVGVVFDGNIESLSGSFIFDTEFNRAISVHSAGMLGALHYVYKAKRLEKELLAGKIK